MENANDDAKPKFMSIARPHFGGLLPGILIGVSVVGLAAACAWLTDVFLNVGYAPASSGDFYYSFWEKLFGIFCFGLLALVAVGLPIYIASRNGWRNLVKTYLAEFLIILVALILVLFLASKAGNRCESSYPPDCINCGVELNMDFSHCEYL